MLLRTGGVAQQFPKFLFQEICSKHWKFTVGIYFQSICKIYNFSNVTSICPKYYCTQSSCAKKVVEKFGFNEVKIEIF